MSHPPGLEPIHRGSDGELVGYVSREDRDGESAWIARALFGGELRAFGKREPAIRFLRERGLPLLAEKWWYHSDDRSDPRLTFLVEARLGAVTVRFGYDPDPANVAVLHGAALERLSLQPIPAGNPD
jgi:hypothetical protein